MLTKNVERFFADFCEIEKNKNADEKCGTLFKKKISKKRGTHGDSKKKIIF